MTNSNVLYNFFFFQEGVSVDHYLKTFDSRKKSQPFILVCGGNFKKPLQQYVIVERHTVATKSLLGAIDLAYKTFQVLHLQYAPQTQGVWHFIDSLVYDVKVPHEQGSIKSFRAYCHFESK